MIRKYALTGGPGTGKSTLLAELQKRGNYTMREVAEHLIQRELERKGEILPWINRDAFQKRLLETQLEWEREIPQEVEMSFQDRGIPDGIAYYKLDNLTPPQRLIDAAKKANYEEIFLLDPLPTYKQTEIRHEDREGQIRIHSEIKEAYKGLGYNPIRIPAGTLNYRAEYILDLIKFEPKLEMAGGRKS